MRRKVNFHLQNRNAWTDALGRPLQRRPRLRSAGFTLVEVLVVVLIITILGTLVGLQVVGGPGKARVGAATAQIRVFRSAMQLYKANHGRYPTQSQGLQALVSLPSSTPIPSGYPAEGYLSSQNLPLDPWNNPYIYLIPGSHGEAYEIITYGADAEPGGEDEAADITSADM